MARSRAWIDSNFRKILRQPSEILSFRDHTRPCYITKGQPRLQAMPGNVSQSAEDYLERIHELIETKGSAHVADIAQFFKENPKALAKFQSTRNNGSLD